MKKRLIGSLMALAMLVSILCVPVSAASFSLRNGPEYTGSERCYSATVAAEGTGKNQLSTSVSSFYRDGSGNVYGRCTSHTTTSGVTYTSTGTKTIKVRSGVVKGTAVQVQMSLVNYASTETIRASGTVG